MFYFGYLLSENFAYICLCLILLKYRYSSFAAYGQSKLANVLHANELARAFKVYKLLSDSSEIDDILTVEELTHGTLSKFREF